MPKKIIYLIILIQFTLFLNACDNTLPVDSNIASSFIDNQESYCMIDLRGEVMYPGIYKIESGTLLYEVIEFAGGVTKNANLDDINLVSSITSNIKITIPNKSIDMVSNSSQININTCTKEELMSIPKIGSAKATAIIEYRNQHGSFTSIEEIKNVNGVGDALFEEIKIYITI